MARPSIPRPAGVLPAGESAAEAETRAATRTKDAKARAHELVNEDTASTIALKKRFFSSIVTFVCGWLGVVLLILILSGAGALRLSDRVLLALLGTTSLNLVGLLFVIANHLFPKGSRSGR